MNTVFHLASLGFLLALIWLLLKVQKERDVLRLLLFSQQAAPTQQRVMVESPLVFLRRFAAALNVPFEAEGVTLPKPAALRPGPFTELFLHSGITLIRCLEPKVAGGSPQVVELRLARPSADPLLASRLSAALGGGVDVTLL